MSFDVRLASVFILLVPTKADHSDVSKALPNGSLCI